MPYKLPSGRVVKLRGKWDSVDTIGREGVYLQENKSKGNIDEVELVRQLTFDLQTMLYLISLQESGVKRVKGVRYNVIRRPLSGGKGSIRQKQPTKSNPAGESKADFYDRLQEYFVDNPEEWFYRWKVKITATDIKRFKEEFLDPCLEEVCLWYDYITTGASLFGTNKASQGFIHYRFPYGVWNPLTEGRAADVDNYIRSGSMTGLHYVNSLFPELEG